MQIERATESLPNSFDQSMFFFKEKFNVQIGDVVVLANDYFLNDERVRSAVYKIAHNGSLSIVSNSVSDVGKNSDFLERASSIFQDFGWSVELTYKIVALDGDLERYWYLIKAITTTKVEKLPSSNRI